MDEELTDEEKADEVLSHVKGGINWHMPSRKTVEEADLVIGDPCNRRGGHKYYVLKARYPVFANRPRARVISLNLPVASHSAGSS